MDEQNNITKRQHFVPQFYLKRFLGEGNVVQVLDPDNRKIIAPSGTKGICYEMFFYSVHTGELDEISQMIEKYFTELETLISKKYNSILAKILNNEQIEDDDKWLLSLLMSMLWIRGPVMRKQINDMSEQIIKSSAKFRFSNDMSSWFDKFDKETGKTTSKEIRDNYTTAMVSGDYKIEFSNIQHLSMLESLENYANLFFHQNWLVYISKINKKFTTSDNPITVITPKRTGFYGATFLERTHCLPLSPDIFIETKYAFNKSSSKKIKRKTLLREDDVKKVLDFNFLTSDHAYEYVYARDKESLEDILNEVSNLYEKSNKYVEGALRLAARYVVNK